MLNGQDQTVGLFEYDIDKSFNGYTLVAPNTTSAYLIDNCGEWVHRWDTAYSPGAASYLLENGILLRTCRIPGTFVGGGFGGRVEMYDWESNLIWGHDFLEDDVFHQHHDIEYMPNGNILILAWEEFGEEAMLQAGRAASALTDQGVWLEQILEVKPIGVDEIEIVWEWHAGDHLIQEINPSVDNFGSVSENPNKINLNYFLTNNSMTSPDYLHANSIDYNPELDQILLSIRKFSEIWIIDHSTTTEEAASSSGGTSGKGGDILYRYGNPEAYDSGGSSDRVFFGQHDAKWITQGSLYRDHIMVYNNGDGRPNGSFSTADIINPTLLENNNYGFNPNGTFTPQGFAFTSEGITDFEIFSPRTSGAYMLPNDNILLCEGQEGVFVEMTQEGEQVWRYANPLSPNGITVQEEFPINVGVFKTERYAPDYPAFAGRQLLPQGPIELEPYDQNCILSSIEPTFSTESIIINTLITQDLHLDISAHNVSGKIFNMSGSQVLCFNTYEAQAIDLGFLVEGIYQVVLFDERGQMIEGQRIIKL